MAFDPVSRRLGLLTMLMAGLAAACDAQPGTPTGSGHEANTQAGLQVSNARVRELIPGQDKTVGYLDVTNHGAKTAVLVRAESDVARAIEFHTSYLDGSIMRMRRLPRVEIAPGSSVHFEPGGNHLMLFGVRSLAADNEIRLITEDEREIAVRFRRVPIDG